MKQETKYSPAPWRRNRHASMTIETITGRSVATTGGYSDASKDEEVYEENLANAKLITAAPDLLEALQELVSDWEALSDFIPNFLNEEAYIKAKDVIKKATEI